MIYLFLEMTPAFNNKNYTYIKEDIRDSDKFDEILKDNKIDVVLHLAVYQTIPHLSLILNFKLLIMNVLKI